MSKGRWSRIAGGAAVLALFGAGVWWLSGHSVMGVTLGARKPVPSLLKKGSPIQLALLEPISSGSTEKGALVQALVLEDVRDEAGILIAAGTPTKVEVTRSRGSSAMTNLINQPARLSVRLTKVRAVDGQSVPLELRQGSPEDDYDITREMTSGQNAGDAIQKLWSNPETQAPLKALQDRLTGKDPEAELKAPDLKKALEEVSKEMHMPETEKALKNEKTWSALSEAIRRAGKGDLSTLGGSEASLALGALKELGHLAGTVGDSLKGVFKGSNITLPVGAKLTGFCSKAMKILPKAPSAIQE